MVVRKMKELKEVGHSASLLGISINKFMLFGVIGQKSERNGRELYF